MSPGRQKARKSVRLLPAFFMLFSLGAGLGQGQDQPKPTGQAPGTGKTEPAASPDASTLRTLKKSLFIPGWGQAGEKHYIEAAFFFGAQVFCLVGVLSNNHRGNENYALYKQAATTEDAVKARALTERYDRRRNQFILAAAAVWAVNLVDTYLIVKGKGGQGKAKALRFRIDTGEDPQLALSLRLGF